MEPVTELGDSAARRQRGAPARTPTGIDEWGGDDSDAAKSEDIAEDAARDGKTHPTEDAALQRVLHYSGCRPHQTLQEDPGISREYPCAGISSAEYCELAQPH